MGAAEIVTGRLLDPSIMHLSIGIRLDEPLHSTPAALQLTCSSLQCCCCYCMCSRKRPLEGRGSGRMREEKTLPSDGQATVQSTHPWDERVAGQAINHTLLVYNDPSSAELYHGLVLFRLIPLIRCRASVSLFRDFISLGGGPPPTAAVINLKAVKGPSF